MYAAVCTSLGSLSKISQEDKKFKMKNKKHIKFVLMLGEIRLIFDTGIVTSTANSRKYPIQIVVSITLTDCSKMFSVIFQGLVFDPSVY